MTFHDLAARIAELQPEATPRDVARLCLLLVNCVDDVEELDDESRFSEVWREASIRLQAASDQHTAMAAELDALARTAPESLTKEEVQTLIRAIKVQSQVLRLYVGQPPVGA